MAERGAAHVQQEQNQDQKAGGGATTRRHVGLKHRPSHTPKLLLLPCMDTLRLLAEPSLKETSWNQNHTQNFTGFEIILIHLLPLTV